MTNNVQPITMSPQVLQLLIKDTEQRFADQGVEPQWLAPEFIPYWLRKGFTPEQIVGMAFSTPSRVSGHDRHLGGTES